ncbi:GNAT family N-acetyltransferase [Rhizobium sp. L1K21]|uniref:GNAT family N-acetyltransferase n=1 Tax=Rhizobium sp. L1K21 TaxID=2954933 RepID=UPI0020925754|nr:GNAT family N-acetyltransferase [Rhizobium sp. L1K21]MCO6188192.1 GNAT family N-acetyltransferase [Rhizobium sp. L1K21]
MLENIGIDLERDAPLAGEQSIAVGREGRAVHFYPATVGYELQDELDYLSNRSIERNVFFTGRFLAPALPRLEDRSIRMAILRDEANGKYRARILMPYTIERPGFAMGAPIIRTWSNAFGPLGTPLVDAENAAESIDDFLEALGRPEAKKPPVLVLPDVRLDGQVTQLFRAIAMSKNLPVTQASLYERPKLESLLDGEAYLANSFSAKHMRNFARLWRKLEKQGSLSYQVARQPEEIRQRMEEFLMLEAAGWKGRKRSALVNDRYHAAFAREAVHNLSQTDNVRIHTIDFNGKAIASLLVFLIGGEAYTWKTAFDEAYAAYSPGALLMAQVTEWHLDDANIVRTDSLSTPEHPVMSRFWRERYQMGTLVIGLQPNTDRDIRQVASQLHLYRNTKNVARSIRNRIMSLRNR